MLKYLSISYQMNALNKRHSPVPTKTSEWLSLEDDPLCARRTQIPARRSLEKYTGERTRVGGGTKHRILRMTLNRKPASQNGNPLPRDWVHGTVSFTPSSTWCHSHCPVELCVKGLVPRVFPLVTFVGAWLNQVWEQVGFLDDRELPATCRSAWILSSFSKIPSPLFCFQVLCPEDNLDRDPVLLGLGTEPGKSGQMPLLVWARNVGYVLNSGAFLSVFYRDFLILLQTLQFMIWPSQSFPKTEVYCRLICDFREGKSKIRNLAWSIMKGKKVGLSGFSSWPWYSLAKWPWTRHLSRLCFLNQISYMDHPRVTVRKMWQSF